MSKFKKSSVVVDAIKYNAPIYSNIVDFICSFGDEPNEILLRVWDNPFENRNISNISGTYHLAISTLEGKMKIYNTDWIIRGIKGEYYTCNNDIFIATYEKV